MPTLRDEWSFGPTGAVRLLGAMIVVTLARCARVLCGDVKIEVEVEFEVKARVGLARIRSVWVMVLHWSGVARCFCSRQRRRRA